MHLRRDALAGAAEMIAAIEGRAAGEDGLVATVGRIEVSQIGRASCRERVWSVRVDLGGRRIIKKNNKRKHLHEMVNDKHNTTMHTHRQDPTHTANDDRRI